MPEYVFGSGVSQSDLRKLWKRAFGDGDEFLDRFFGFGYDARAMQAALVNGALAGMLYWFDCTLEQRKYAYIYAVATDPKFEGQGIATGLLKKAQEILEKQGYAGAILVPGSESLVTFYQNRGYEPVSRIGHRTAPAGNPLAVKSIPWSDYMALRTEFLPAHGILQTGRNMAFLQQLGTCYVGERFLAAVSREDPSACMEFLGDPEKLSGFAAALGVTQISCRMPGTESPFAMGIRFTPESWPKEIYFCFAFD